MFPIVRVCGIKVIVSYPNCEPACTSCFTAGHYASNCNSKLREAARKKEINKTDTAPINDETQRKLIRQAETLATEIGCYPSQALRYLQAEERKTQAEVNLELTRSLTRTTETLAETVQAMTAIPVVSEATSPTHLTEAEQLKASRIHNAAEGFSTPPIQSDEEDYIL